MSKSLEEWLLVPANKAAVDAAVEASNADPAYVMKVLEARREALREKKQLDEEIRLRHGRIVKLLEGPQGEWIREKAHEQIDKWERNQLCHPRYVCQWRKWLAMPASFLEAAVLRTDDIGVSMRQNSPFSHSWNLVEPEVSSGVQNA